MRNIKYILVTVFALCFIISCYEDKGNYDYKKSNKITIKNIDRNYSLDITDETSEGVEIDPELEFELERIDNLKYRWSIEGNIVSNEKKLIISKENIIKDSDCRFEVITENGDHFVRDFTVKLASSFEKGWLLLTEKGGVNYLTLIKSEIKKEDETKDETVEYSVYKDVFKKVNSNELGSAAIKMTEHWSGENDFTLCGNVVIVKQDAEGSIEINGSTLVKECRTSDYFLSGHAPEGYKPIDEFYMSGSSVILNSDGALYSRKFSTKELFQSGKFMDEPVYFEQGMNIKMIIPSIYKSVYCGLLFDKKNQRLLYVDEKGKIGTLNYDDYEDGVSDLSDLKKDVIYGGFHGISNWGQNVEYTIILKDGSDFSIENFKLSFESVYVFSDGKCQEVVKLKVENPTESLFNYSDLIKDNTVFCRPRNRQYMYFSSDNKFYVYDLNTNESPILLHKFNKGTITDIDAGYDTKQIGVTLDNGEFYIFNTSISKIADPTDNIIYNYKGDKKIIDLMYKYGQKNNVSF